MYSPCRHLYYTTAFTYRQQKIAVFATQVMSNSGLLPGEIPPIVAGQPLMDIRRAGCPHPAERLPQTGSYHLPFFILPPIKMIAKTETINSPEIQTGDSTHTHDQSIRPVNFNTTNIRVNIDINPIPPRFDFLSIINTPSTSDLSAFYFPPDNLALSAAFFTISSSSINIQFGIAPCATSRRASSKSNHRT